MGKARRIIRGIASLCPSHPKVNQDGSDKHALADKPPVAPVLVALLVLFSGGMVIAEESVGVVAAKVDRSDVQLVYGRVEQWVRAGEVAEQVQPVWVTDVSGVKLTLRLHGRRVGECEVVDLDGEQAVDLAAVAARAAEQTLEQYGQFHRAVVRRALEGHDGAQQEVKGVELASGSRQLTVGLQVARGVQVVDGGELMGIFDPGFHGLRMTTGAGEVWQSGWVWPGSAIAMNMSPRVQVLNLLAKLGFGRPGIVPKRVGEGVGEVHFGPLDLPEVPANVELGIFEVIHLERPSLNQPAVMLVQGQEMLPERPIGTRTVEAISQRLSEHLIGKVVEGGVMSGTFKPTKNVFEPPVASDEEMALAGYVLGRRAGILREIGGDEDQMYAAVDAARELLDGLQGRMVLDGEEQASVRAVALSVMAITRSPGMGRYRQWRDVLTGELLERYGLLGGLHEQLGSKGQATGGDLETMTLAAGALKSVYDLTRNEALGNAAGVMRGRVVMRLKGGEKLDVEGLVWLAVLREMWLNDDQAGEDVAVMTGVLGEALQGLKEGQVRRADAGRSAGSVGGYVLDDYGVPGIDWRSGWATGLVAAGLSDGELVGEADRAGMLLSSALGSRFVGQLMFSASGCWYVPSRDVALGGVRGSLWDNRLTVRGQAAGLWGTMELRRAVWLMGQE